MALIVPSAALVRLIWTLGGSPYAVNVVGVRKTTGAAVDQAFANTVGAAVKGALSGSGLLGAIPTGVTLANVGTRDISTANNAEFLDTAAAVAGSSTFNLLPPQVAYCVTLRTARAGKSFRGRFYMPGLDVTSNTLTGTVVPGVANLCVVFVNAIRTGLPATGVSMAVVSRKLLSTELVTIAQGRDQIWDTIRGRATAGI